MADVESQPLEDPADVGAYCRAVEAHLSRRNAGHLVRIVGPSFDLVSGWAGRGVPLSVACRGIDRLRRSTGVEGPATAPDSHRVLRGGRVGSVR